MLFVSSGRIPAAEQHEGDSHIAVTVDRSTGWGHVAIKGPICLSMLESYMLAAWANEGYAQTRGAIWDLRDAHLTLKLEDLPRLIEFVSLHKGHRGPTTVAVVVDPNREQDVRQGCQALEEGADFSPVIFDDFYDAVGWLGGEVGSGDS